MNQLQTPVVRDLAWACFSQSLLHSEELAEQDQNVSNCDLPLTPRRLNWLQQLDRNPGALQEHLGTRREGRLGLYFESLWHFFLEQDEQTELLAHNLPVREGSQTLGEFDCIYYCRERQRHFHLELAVKFFLGHPGPEPDPVHSHWYQWLGPNARDRLDVKIERLMQHQIRLSEQAAAQDALAQLGIEALEREVEIKGRLFYPGSLEMPQPFACSEKSNSCRWWALDEWPASAICQYTHFALLEKPHWFAPVTPASGLPLMDAGNMRNVLSLEIPARGRPLLVAALDDRGCELSRFFVTHSSWPGEV